MRLLAYVLDPNFRALHRYIEALALNGTSDGQCPRRRLLPLHNVEVFWINGQAVAPLIGRKLQKSIVKFFVASLEKALLALLGGFPAILSHRLLPLPRRA
jgi:hypothetical protein